MMSQSDNFQSVGSQSAISSSSVEHRVLCHCDRKAKIERAWTRENPGRRFFGCKGRRVGNGYENSFGFTGSERHNPRAKGGASRFEEQGERSDVFRNVLVASSVGFAIVLGGIIVMSKLVVDV
ncbi:uncharacterized protein LOC130497750 [Raphanus sativus]|uniref:Uncharacterized protein LOC130497750 n=1 Tax=Raphanus sativus TaxID=3726 RepID=A0A9W3C5S7_RAPSA|nr:uncharacterized protein LOC130497750 [Raphanus sativus]